MNRIILMIELFFNSLFKVYHFMTLGFIFDYIDDRYLKDKSKIEKLIFHLKMFCVSSALFLLIYITTKK